MTSKTRSGAKGLVGWLSVAQLISRCSLFYTFALVMEPVERELGLSRARSSLAFSLALLAEGLMGLLWTPPVGYNLGLWWLLVLSLAGGGALMLAQRASRSR